MSEKQVKLQLSADVGGLLGASAKAGKSLAGLGKAAAEAGSTADASLARIGASSGKAGAAVDKTTRHIIGRVQEASAAMRAGGRDNAAYVQSLAGLRGAEPQAIKSSIHQLADVAAKAREAAAAAKPVAPVAMPVTEIPRLPTKIEVPVPPEKGESREDAAIKTREALRAAESGKAAKAVEDQWKQAATQIEDALATSFTRAFKGAKDWSKDLHATLKQSFSGLKTKFLDTLTEGSLKDIFKPAAGALMGFLLPASAKADGGAGQSAAKGWDSIVERGKQAMTALDDGFKKIGASLSGKVEGALKGIGIDGPGAQKFAGIVGEVGSRAASAATALAISSGLSGGYKLSSGLDTVSKAAVAIAGAFGPQAGLIAGVVSGIVNRAFGMKDKQVAQTGIRGTISDAGVTGQNYANWTQKGGWFRSDKRGTDLTAMGGDMAKQFADGLASIQSATSGFAAALGMTADGIQGYTKNFDIVLGKDEEANKKAVADLFVGIGNDLALRLVPDLATFAKAGEDASTTLQRLAGDFQATDALAKVLGQTAESMFGGAGLSSAPVRDRLVELSGGKEAMAKKADFFVQNFLSEGERITPVIKAVGAAMESLGLGGVKTIDQFKDVVRGLDLTTEADAKQFAALMDLAPAFKQVADYTATLTTAVDGLGTSLRTAADIASERVRLQDELDQLTKSPAELLAKQRAALDPSNHALFDDLQTARTASAARTARQALQDELDQLIMTPAQLIAKQRAAVDPANIDLFDQVQSAHASAAQSTLATQGRQLEIQTMELGGNVAGALAARRQLELAAMDESLRPIQQRIYALQDEKTATADALAAADSAMGGLTRAVNAQKTALQNAYQRQVDAFKEKVELEKQAAQASLDAASTAAGAIHSVFDRLSSAARSMRELTRVEGQAILNNALQYARQGGNLAKFDGLEEALAAVGKDSSSQFATFAEFKRDQALTAGTVAALTAAAGDQVSVADMTLTAIQDSMQAADAAAKAQLDAMADANKASIDYLDGILSGAQAQLDALRGIDNSVQSVSTALAAFGSSITKANAVQASSQAPTRPAGQSIDAVYQQILGRAPDVQGKLFWTRAFGDTIDDGEALEMLKAARPELAAKEKGPAAWHEFLRNAGVPGYATGGLHPGGLRLVGENGPELEVSGPARYFSNSQTADLLRPGGADSGELIAEVRKLREEVEGLRAETRAVAGHTSRTSRIFDQVTQGGNAILTKETIS